MRKFASLLVYVYLISSLSVVEGQPGYIYTFAGQVNAFGNQGPATAAPIYNPTGIAISSSGDIFVVDSKDYVVRKVAFWQ